MAEKAARPRTVLMTADAVGGVWVYTRELVTALAREGIHVVVATMGPRPSDAQRAELLAIPSVTLRESDFALEWMDDPWDDVAAAGEWLLEIARETSPDIVHLNGYSHAALAWGERVPVVVVAHSCVASWWRAVHGEDPPPRFARYRREVRRAAAYADAVVAPTRAMLSVFEELHGRPRRSVVIPNAVASVTFAPQEKLPYVFSAGRLWDDAKNVRALAAVAPRLPWPIFVAGEDRSPDGARDGDASTAAGVKYLGHLDTDAMATWLGRAMVYALPARYEPFGLSVVEAGLSGCALVLGDIPSLREVWGEDATYVPPDDHAALHAALTMLLADGEARAAAAERAQRRAAGFRRASLGGAYASLYRELGAT